MMATKKESKYVVYAEKILKKYKNAKDMLIQMLLDIQEEFHWLPQESLIHLSKKLNVPLTSIYWIATFYKAFSLKPRGRHLIRVCLGTACHVRGGLKIMDKVSELLKIKDGETTKDGRFTLQSVYCLGCCALGPVMVVDNNYHGNLKDTMVKAVLNKYA